MGVRFILERRVTSRAPARGPTLTMTTMGMRDICSQVRAGAELGRVRPLAGALVPHPRMQKLDAHPYHGVGVGVGFPLPVVFVVVVRPLVTGTSLFSIHER